MIDCILDWGDGTSPDYCDSFIGSPNLIMYHQYGPNLVNPTLTVNVEDEDGIETDLVRVTTDFTPDLEDYDPADDADLYEELLVEKEDSAPPIPRKIWVQQCEAAEGIEADYGTEKALGYLIEDAAEALGATYRGQAAGTFGEIGCFSLRR